MKATYATPNLQFCYLFNEESGNRCKKNYAETDFFSSRGYLDTFFRNLCANESTNCDFFYPLLFDKYFIFQDHRNTIKRHHQKNSKTKSVLIHASREITILKISSDFWKAYKNRCAQKRQKRSNNCLGNGKPHRNSMHNAPKSRRVEGRAPRRILKLPLYSFPIFARGTTMFADTVRAYTGRDTIKWLEWKFSTVLLFCPNWVEGKYGEYLAGTRDDAREREAEL